MEKSLKRLISSLALIAFFMTGAIVPSMIPAAGQQERTLTGIIEGKGFTKIKIGIPQLFQNSSVSSDQSSEIRRTITDDLAYSGYFEPLTEFHYALIRNFSESNLQLKEWNAVGADVTFVGRIEQSGSKVLVEGRLFDTLSGKMIMGKSYSGSIDILRRIAHRIADDIIFHFTGLQGLGLTRIAFSSKIAGAKEIYIMDYDGQRVRRLTKSGAINLSPVWSPDGEKLAFISIREGATGIHIIDSSGNAVITRSRKGDLNSAPDWSPDGSSIVFSSNETGNSEIYKMNLATGRTEQLTHHGAIDSSPCWSPTGREIAFTSDRSGSPQIYIMDAEGANVRRITADGNYNDSAAWSPKGDRIAYVSRMEGKFNILLYDLNIGSSLRLTDSSGNNENPRWSKDGRHIVFASNRTGAYNIFTMNADGSSQNQLTFSGGCFTPDWSK